MTNDQIRALTAAYVSNGGAIAVVEPGVRAIAPAIMREAEKGAMVDDFIAAHRFGLITRATPMRTK